MGNQIKKCEWQREMPRFWKTLATLAKAIRLHHWLKNLLLFVPLIIAHRIEETQLIINAFAGFISFSLCASSVYLVNDITDLKADKMHPVKRRRPFASGKLPLYFGFILPPIFLAIATVIALSLPMTFLQLIAIYLLISLTYSLKLKKIPLIDVLILAGLYTLRLFAGSVATGIPISFWLLAFSMFIFLSLAIIKRYSELQPIAEKQASAHIPGRGYHINDLATIQVFGICSGYISILVLALYINSDQVHALYRQPYILWALCPIFLYWISYAWMLAGRGEMVEDPLIFALRDQHSLVVGFITLFVIYWAT